MRKRTHARNALEQPRDDINERVGELEALNAKQVMTRQISSFVWYFSESVVLWDRAAQGAIQFEVLKGRTKGSEY